MLLEFIKIIDINFLYYTITYKSVFSHPTIGGFFYVKKIDMIQEIIPFKIGSQYEHWEFDLEPISNTRYLDIYLYIKDEINTIFQIPISRIYLSFNLDILVKIKYDFKPMYYQQLKFKLIDFFTDKDLKRNENAYSTDWEFADKILRLYNQNPQENIIHLTLIAKSFYCRI